MNNFIYLFILIGTMIGALGGFCLKKSTSNENLFKAFISPFLYCGAALYLFSAILNIVVLKYLPYSVVLPLTSITYIWSLFIAFYFLKEKITKIKIYGVICITIGAVFIAI